MRGVGFLQTYPHTVASPGLRLTTSQVPLRALSPPPPPFPRTAAGLSNGDGRRRVCVWERIRSPGCISSHTTAYVNLKLETCLSLFVVSRRRVSRTAAGDDGCMFVVWWRCVRSVLRVVSRCCSKLRLLRAASTCGFYTASSCGFYARLLRSFLLLMLLCRVRRVFVCTLTVSRLVCALSFLSFYVRLLRVASSLVPRTHALFLGAETPNLAI